MNKVLPWMLLVVVAVASTLQSCGTETTGDPTEPRVPYLENVDSGPIACGTTNASVTPSFVVTCTSGSSTGLAPLACFFDARGTTATGVGATRVFHDLRFRWDFGSAFDGRSWAPTGRPMRYAFGPQSAIVFDAGVHTVAVEVTDSAGNLATTCVDVTADDGWTDTTACISSSGKFDGCPSSNSADHFTVTGSYTDAIAARFGAGYRRICFRGGERWQSSSRMDIDVPGASYVGACEGFGTDRPTFAFNGNAEVAVRVGSDDARVVGINFEGPGNNALIGSSGRLAGLLMLGLRAEPRSFSNLSSFSWQALGGQPPHEAIFMVDMTFINGAGGSSAANFWAVQRSAWLGSRVKEIHTEHVMRFPWFYDLVISNNDLGPQSGGNKAVITLRAPDNVAPDDCSASGAGFGQISARATISENLFEGYAAMVAAIEGCAGGAAANGADILVERNVFERWRNADSVINAVALSNDVDRGTVRNNIFRLNQWRPNGDSLGFRAITIHGGHSAYGNSGWSDTSAQGNQILVEVVGTGSHCTNNVLYAPAASNGRVVTGSCTTTGSNVLAGGTNPFVGTSNSGNPADYLPAPTGALIDQGMAPPAPMADFRRQTNPTGAVDIGALESF